MPDFSSTIKLIMNPAIFALGHIWTEVQKTTLLFLMLLKKWHPKKGITLSIQQFVSKRVDLQESRIELNIVL